MVTFIGLLSGTTAAAVYGLYLVANNRLEAGQSGARRQLGSDPRYRRTQVGTSQYYRAHRHAD